MSELLSISGGGSSRRRKNRRRNITIAVCSLAVLGLLIYLAIVRLYPEDTAPVVDPEITASISTPAPVVDAVSVQSTPEPVMKATNPVAAVFANLKNAYATGSAAFDSATAAPDTSLILLEWKLRLDIELADMTAPFDALAAMTQENGAWTGENGSISALDSGVYSFEANVSESGSDVVIKGSMNLQSSALTFQVQTPADADGKFSVLRECRITVKDSKYYTQCWNAGEPNKGLFCLNVTANSIEGGFDGSAKLSQAPDIRIAACGLRPVRSKNAKQHFKLAGYADARRQTD